MAFFYLIFSYRTLNLLFLLFIIRGLFDRHAAVV